MALTCSTSRPAARGRPVAPRLPRRTTAAGSLPRGRRWTPWPVRVSRSSIETWDATAVDYDGDGDQDVWVGYHDQGGKLWRNNGSGDYTRVAGTWPRGTPRAGCPTGTDCDWADVDRNGLPDAYCAAGRGGNNLVKTGQDNELWLQTPVGSSPRSARRGAWVTCADAVTTSRSWTRTATSSPTCSWGTRVHVPSPTRATTRPTACPTRRASSTSTRRDRFPPVRNWGITGYGGVRCAEVVDFNRDGWDDLLVAAVAGTLLYRNNAAPGSPTSRRPTD